MACGSGPSMRLADQIEKIKKLAGLIRYATKLRQEAQRLVKFGLDPCLPASRCPAPERRLRFQRIQLAPDFLQHAVDDRGVLANVEAHRAEAEGFDLPAHAAARGWRRSKQTASARGLLLRPEAPRSIRRYPLKPVPAGFPPKVAARRSRSAVKNWRKGSCVLRLRIVSASPDKLHLPCAAVRGSPAGS